MVFSILSPLAAISLNALPSKEAHKVVHPHWVGREGTSLLSDWPKKIDCQHHWLDVQILARSQHQAGSRTESLQVWRNEHSEPGLVPASLQIHNKHSETQLLSHKRGEEGGGKGAVSQSYALIMKTY